MNHLAQNAVYMYFIDNWSTDGTYERLENLRPGNSFIRGVERFPIEGETGQYEWRLLLERKVYIASKLSGYDWYLHYDADELRESPWPYCTLRQGLHFVDALGFNAIDHTVIEFRPIADGYDGLLDPKSFFHFFEFGNRAGCFVQIKGWKRQDTCVDLVSSGGHEVVFS